MWKELEILIWNDNEMRSSQLSTILNFLGENCSVINSEALPEFLKEEKKFLAVFIGQVTQSSAKSLAKQIHNWDKQVPLVLMDDGLTGEEIEPVVQAQVVGVLDWPARYAQLMDLLHQCQVCRNNRHAVRVNERSSELFRSLVGNSKVIQEVRRLIEHVAQTDANVLVLGETGTGKEVVARNLHYMSTRRAKPFVPVNCGAIPADLLESELFGHEKGAFTGAITARQGRFELAQGGTLFLDEIGDMPMSLQVKILRVLQEKTFERVGSNKTIQADVRIIAATHRNLERLVEDGKFREDLFYRLNVFPIEVPAMRERKEDVHLLVNELVSRLESNGAPAVRLSPNALISLSRYDWPGNVRELANLIERLAILHPFGVVDVTDLPTKYRFSEGLSVSQTPALAENRADKSGAVVNSNVAMLPNDGLNLKDYMAELEISFINQALNESGGVVARAAERLQMRRTTLVEKMRKYGLTRDEEVSEV